MKTRRVWKTTVRATLALLQIYKQFCLYCKHINVETQKSNVAALGGSVAVTFRYCFACTMQVKMYAATAAALRSIGTSLRFFFFGGGLQLNSIISLSIDLRLRARPVKKVTVTCLIPYSLMYVKSNYDVFDSDRLIVTVACVQTRVLLASCQDKPHLKKRQYAYPLTLHTFFIAPLASKVKLTITDQTARAWHLHALFIPFPQCQKPF